MSKTLTLQSLEQRIIALEQHQKAQSLFPNEKKFYSIEELIEGLKNVGLEEDITGIRYYEAQFVLKKNMDYSDSITNDRIYFQSAISRIEEFHATREFYQKMLSKKPEDQDYPNEGYTMSNLLKEFSRRTGNFVNQSTFLYMRDVDKIFDADEMFGSKLTLYKPSCIDKMIHWVHSNGATLKKNAAVSGNLYDQNEVIDILREKYSVVITQPQLMNFKNGQTQMKKGKKYRYEPILNGDDWIRTDRIYFKESALQKIVDHKKGIKRNFPLSKKVFQSYVDAVNKIIDKAIPKEPKPPVLESEYGISPTLEEIDEYRETLILYNLLNEEYKATQSFRDSLEELRTQVISELLKKELGFYSAIPEKYQTNIWNLIVTSSGYRWSDIYDAIKLQVSIFSNINEE